MEPAAFLPDMLGTAGATAPGTPYLQNLQSLLGPAGRFLPSLFGDANQASQLMNHLIASPQAAPGGIAQGRPAAPQAPALFDSSQLSAAGRKPGLNLADMLFGG